MLTPHRLIAAVRTARSEGVEPRICNCHICAQRRPQVLASVGRRRDLTMVFGISWAYAAALGALGARRYDDLEALDPAAVVASFRRRHLSISVSVVEGWKLHARAYAQGRPVLSRLRPALPALGRYIALDLEWDLAGRIWLAAAGLVIDDEAGQVSQWWADDKAEERTALAKLADLLLVYPDTPVLTWNGKAADLPRLRDRCAQLGVGQLVSSLEPRHYDLYIWAQKSLRLPMPGFGLKEVSASFGFKGSSGVRSGMEAMMLFEQYRRAPGPVMKQKLMAYNRDDVASLALVAKEIVQLDHTAPRGPAPHLLAS